MDDLKKLKIINLVCRRYVSINSKKELEFKKYLKYAIDKKSISKDDALSIVLELMYGVNNYNWDFKNIVNELENLVLNVEKYNDDNQVNLKKSVLFFKDYSYENKILEEYINNLSPESIETDINKIASKRISKNDLIKQIKDNLNHLSKEDLCNILGIAPELNFEKDKILKDKIAKEFVKYSVDPKKLKGKSSNFIKKYLNDLIEESKESQPNEPILKTNEKKDLCLDEHELKYQIDRYNLKIRYNFKPSKSTKNNKNQPKTLPPQEDNRTSSHFKNVKSKTAPERNRNGSKTKPSKFVKGNQNAVQDIKNKKKLLDKYRNYRQTHNQSRSIHHQNIMHYLEKNVHSTYGIYGHSSKNLSHISNSQNKKRARNKGADNNQDEKSNKYNRKNKIKSSKYDNNSNLKTSHAQEENRSSSQSKKVKTKITAERNRNGPKTKPSKLVKGNKNAVQETKNYNASRDTLKLQAKINFQKVLEKIKEFNEKSFQDMLQSKEEYSTFYQFINDSKEFNSKMDVKKFVYYYSHFNEIEEANKFIKEFKKHNHKLNEFKSKLNCDEYLSYSYVKHLLIDFKNYYEFISKINNFHTYIKDKITSQFEYIVKFMEYYDDLKEYAKFDEISDNNPNLNFNNKIYKINQDYIDKGIRKYRKFFEKIYNGKSLDNDQIKAVLTDDDATQIIAGAGTGKTLTLQGKIKFLIEERNIPPEDILCISYSVASKEDLKDKIEKTIGKKDIEVKTFHSVGSQILKINEEKSRVKEKALNRAIDLYFKNVVFKDQKLMQSIITFFSSYFKNTESQLNNPSTHQTMKSMIHSVDNTTNYDEIRTQDEIVTVDREYVRSVEELIIANFLYIHGIDYVYEKEYTVKNEFYQENLENYLDFLFVNCEYIPRNIKLELYDEIKIDLKEFKFGFYPDFYLPDKQIYMEHFGVDRNCEATWLKTDEQRKNYKKAMDHKTKIFKDNNTNFIATYSYYNHENRLTSRLEEKLREHGVEVNEVDYEFIFNELILNGKLKEYKLFKRVISTFINLFKGNAIYLDENGKDISKIMFKKFKGHNEKENTGDLQKRNSIFLNLIEEIYEYYNFILSKANKIDFNDMINNATIALKNGAKIHNYKYIIVDEYQDTSHTRYNLLKEIQKRTNAKITVVGDDWQSIYGFTGCDIHLFSDFKEYFKHPSIVKIQNTYRNSQALINIAGSFIQNNPGQIKKDLKSTNVTYKKPVKLAHYNDPIDEIIMFIYILREINKKVINNPKKAEVLVLGRNNFDVEEIACGGLFSTEKLKNETIITPELEKMNLRISFRTIHKSKGLEADYVILLNLNDKLAGFPNKIENDPILDYVTIKKEEIPFAEERRLFYVALTRTLNDIFLLVPMRKQSQFILELELYGYILDRIEHDIKDESLYSYIQENIKKTMIEIETEHTCPKCKIGKVKLLFNTKKGTKFFRCTEQCGWNGGWYYGSLEDVQHVKVCKKCHGMIILKTDLNGKKYPSCNFYAKRHKHGKRFKKYRY